MEKCGVLVGGFLVGVVVVERDGVFKADLMAVCVFGTDVRLARF